MSNFMPVLWFGSEEGNLLENKSAEDLFSDQDTLS